MEITQFLSPADIMIDVHASDKTRLLQRLSAQAASAIGLDSDEVSEEITKREELGSTGVGNVLRSLTRGSPASKRRSDFSPVYATASILKPSMASRLMSSFCSCYPKQATARS
jgi:hypothetical protein